MSWISALISAGLMAVAARVIALSDWFQDRAGGRLTLRRFLRDPRNRVRRGGSH